MPPSLRRHIELAERHAIMLTIAHSLPNEETESGPRNEEESEAHPSLGCLSSIIRTVASGLGWPC